jgi:hypothetical protein
VLQDRIVPQIVLAQQPDGTYNVMDGKQRLVSLLSFYSGGPAGCACTHARPAWARSIPGGGGAAPGDCTAQAAAVQLLGARLAQTWHAGQALLGSQQAPVSLVLDEEECGSYFNGKRYSDLKKEEQRLFKVRWHLLQREGCLPHKQTPIS